MYYLQSRYYDSVVRRYLNGDVYFSTGNGIVGNNMFAYCNNNPTVLADTSGKSPVSPLTIGDYYIIHKMVQADCIAKNGWRMEVYVSGAKGRGFLDLYDSGANQYYEVKSKKAARRKSTATQMQKYDVALIMDKRISTPASVPPTRGTQYVSGSFEYGAWDIEYHLTSPGLITYTAEYNYKRGGTYLAVATVVGLAFITEGASIPYTAPILGLA